MFTIVKVNFLKLIFTRWIIKEIKIEQCPFCERSEFIETKVCSYGGVYVSPVVKGGLRGSALFATICRNCGSVVRTYCKDAEKLFPKKERREK